MEREDFDPGQRRADNHVQGLECIMAELLSSANSSTAEALLKFHTQHLTNILSPR